MSDNQHQDAQQYETKLVENPYPGKAKVIGYTDDGQPIVDAAYDKIFHRPEVVRHFGQTTRVVQFATARTMFPARQAEPTPVNGLPGEREVRRRWNRLWAYQHKWDSDEEGRRAYRDKLNRAEALADALGLSRYQRSRVVDIVANANGRRFNQIGGLDALALGAIAAVADQDADSIDDRVVGSEQYNSICDHHNVDGWAACRKAKEIMRERNSD